MGLDIHLLKYPSPEIRERELEFLRLDNEYWASMKSPEYEALTDEEKQKFADVEHAKMVAFAERHGLVGGDGYGYGHKEIELDSRRYPEHGFKIGYFRSSYFGGFNSVMNAAIGKDLYWIFEPDAQLDQDDNDGIVAVDWERAHYRARVFLAELAEAFEAGVRNIHAESDYWNAYMGNDPSKIPKPANENYLQACEIVVETIEFVLASDEPENFYMGWW